MLWSSSGIREARKEIGSAQPRWSKKFGGLKYTGYIRLGGSIAIPTTFSGGLLTAWRVAERFYVKGFGFLFDNTSYVVLVFASLFL